MQTPRSFCSITERDLMNNFKNVTTFNKNSNSNVTSLAKTSGEESLYEEFLKKFPFLTKRIKEFKNKENDKEKNTKKQKQFNKYKRSENTLTTKCNTLKSFISTNSTSNSDKNYISISDRARANITNIKIKMFNKSILQKKKPKTSLSNPEILINKNKINKSKVIISTRQNQIEELKKKDQITRIKKKIYNLLHTNNEVKICNNYYSNISKFNDKVFEAA